MTHDGQPAGYAHKRKDDVVISRHKILALMASTAATAIIGTIMSSYLGGVLITPDRLKNIVADSPAIVQLKEDVENLKHAGEQSVAVQQAINDRLFTMNEHIANIAKQTGAELPAPRQQPLQPSSSTGKARDHATRVISDRRQKTRTDAP